MFKRMGIQALQWFWRHAGLWVVPLAGGLILFWCVATSDSKLRGDSTFSPESASAFIGGMAFETGEPQGVTQTVGGLKWYEAANDEQTRLWLQPATGQIALTDRRTGGLWLSNPLADDPLLNETKGIWRSNLSSPFLFSFIESQKTTPTFSNPSDQKAVVSWHRIERGIGVLYSMEAVKIRVYIEYQLEQGELLATIPAHGVQDNENNRMLTLDLLPYFGAAKTGSEGYLLVPDGPGGLIAFGTKREANLSPYNQPVYGRDPTVTATEPELPRFPISYPVFGMRKDGAGWIGMIEAGATKAYIKASAAGINTSFFNSNASFHLRHSYRQPTGLFSGKSVYEQHVNLGEMSVRYVLLDRESSDYVGMAQAYRKYLMENRQVRKLEAEQSIPPISLEFIVSGGESTSFGEKTVVMTSFDDVRRIVGQLQELGLEGMRIGLSGWQYKGLPGYNPKLFPVSKEAGGEKGLTELVGELQAREHSVSLTMVPIWAMDRSGVKFPARQEGVRSITGSIYKATAIRDYDKHKTSHYLIDPTVIYNRYMPQSLEKIRPLGIKDVYLLEMGSTLYGNYDEGHYISREDSLDYSRRILQAARKSIGRVSTNTGFDYVLGAADHINGFPTSYNHDLLIDEQVPFYPIAVHGLATYNAGYGNMRSDPDKDWLRDIEYGALPLFLVSQADPRIMKKTYFHYVYSSGINVLEEQIVAEYEAVKETQGGVWASFIADHNKLEEGVYETVYEGGRKVIVNYNDHAYTDPKGIRVKPKSYAVVPGGRNQ